MSLTPSLAQEDNPAPKGGVGWVNSAGIRYLLLIFPVRKRRARGEGEVRVVQPLGRG